MNRKNFETVLEQYMGRLAGLEQADDSDQVYKWRAVGCFKRFWNLDAADFAGMFEKAMQEGYSTASEEARSLGFGAGMGLPNMKKYTDTMQIESTVGVGTTVRMTVLL